VASSTTIDLMVESSGARTPRLMVRSSGVTHRRLQYSDLDPSFFSVASAAHRRLQYSNLQAIDSGIHITIVEYS
jgi:hypothetical protein